MSDERPKRSFWDIYREQYRQTSSSKTSRAFRIISPIVLVIGLVFARRISGVVMIVVAVLAVVCFVAAVLFGRRQRRGTSSN